MGHELLRIEGLSYGDESGKFLFKGVNLQLFEGQRLGLIAKKPQAGRVFLEILASKRIATEGSLKFLPALQVSYLAPAKALRGQLEDFLTEALQGLRDLEREVRALESQLNTPQQLLYYTEAIEAFEAQGGYEALNLEAKLKGLLSFDLSKDQDLSKLSAGQQRQLSLATLLSQRAGLYLLDEPSLFLDLNSRQRFKDLLLKTLKKQMAALIIHSQDRELLNSCSHILELSPESGELLRGNYDSYLKQKGHRLITSARKAHEMAKEHRQLELSLAKLKPASPQYQAIKARLAKLAPPASLKASQVLPSQALGQGVGIKERLCKLEALGLEGLLKPFSKEIYAGDKIALVGSNGSGKSSLLERIAALNSQSEAGLGEIHWHEDAKMRYIDQKQGGLDFDLSPLEQLTRYVSEGRAYELLRLLGLPFQSEVITLARDERAKLSIALMMASHANVILIDELDSQLDLASLEAFEEALLSSEAAIIFVSHDERLIENVAGRLWAIEEGELREYQGGLQGYRAGQSLVEVVVEAVREEVGVEERREGLEHQTQTLTQTLLDPLHLSPREQERLHKHLKDCQEQLYELYESLQPPPLPQFERHQNHLSLTGDKFEDDSYLFKLSSQLQPDLSLEGFQLKLKISKHIGHIQLIGENFSPLPWALHIALELLSRCAFEHLEVHVLQIYSPYNLKIAHFAQAKKDLGQNWWIFKRSYYEKLLGYGDAKR
ncbi:MAG: ATP-binding cassette domain-containing protein [Deinococcales bacterium]